MLSRRDALASDVRAAASAQIVARATALLAPRCAPGSIVALYAAKGSEVDTGALDSWARGHGLRVAYPRVIDDTRTLSFHEVAPDALVPRRYGLHEPAPDAPLVALADIRAFIIPGLAFDRTGGRIGWGRGYYDATLTAAPSALRVGLAFECQLVDHVPNDPHDALLHHVVTELAIYPSP